VRAPLTPLGKALLLVVVLAAIGATLLAVSSSFSSSSSSSGGSFTLLQMNLCLSGRAGCYSADTHDAVLNEATRVIDDHAPDAVTVNEACRRDVADLAARAGRLWQALADGTLKRPPIERHALGAADEAHRRLESRRTIGALVLIA